MKIQIVDYLEYFSSGANNFGVRQRFIDANSEKIGTDIDVRGFKYFTIISNVATYIYMQGEDKYLRPFVVYPVREKEFISLYQKKIIYTDALLGNSDGYLLRSGGASVVYSGKVNQVGSLTIVCFNEMSELLTCDTESVIKNGFNFKLVLTGASSIHSFLNQLSRYDLDYIYNTTGNPQATVLLLGEIDIANYEQHAVAMGYFGTNNSLHMRQNNKITTFTVTTVAPLYRHSPVFNHKHLMGTGSNLTVYVSF